MIYTYLGFSSIGIQNRTFKEKYIIIQYDLKLIIYIFYHFSEPYAAYKIWIKAYTTKNEGKSSDPVDVTTDVRAPGQPIGKINMP